MHTALGMAARRGIEDTRRLLHAAGNDITTLEKSTSLTNLMLKMRIA